MGPQLSKSGALRQLLVRLFPPASPLQLFIQDYYVELLPVINFSQTPAMLASDVVQVLQGRGYLDPDFFDLLAERDGGGHKQAIEAVRTRWFPAPAPPEVAGAPSALARVSATRLSKSGPEAMGADGHAVVVLGASIESTAGAQPTEGLQAIVDHRNGLQDPAAFLAGIANAMRRTAMIEIRGHPAGTGFLVGNRHLLTNAHVVQATTAPPPQNLQVQVVFDFFAGGLVAHAERGRRTTGRVVAHSLPTQAEVNGSASDWNAPATNLDYALIELAEPVGSQPGGSGAAGGLVGSKERGFLRMSTVDYRFDQASLLLVTQHPLGERMAQSHATPPFGVNGAKTRVRYNANTLNGSSGSSVIDHRGRLVALHHYQATGQNQGIPIYAIANDLEARGFDHLVVDNDD